MFTKSQLSVILSIAKGNDNIHRISESEGLSIPQTYRVVNQLTAMKLVSKKDKILLERIPLTDSLVKMLEFVPDVDHALSGNGLEILSSLKRPMTVPEIVKEENLDLSQTYSKMRELYSRSMVVKDGRRYSANIKLWTGLEQLLLDFRRYRDISIEDTPVGATIYHTSKDETIFSCSRANGYVRTAFSRYDEYGIDFVPQYEYYSTADVEPDLNGVFLHSLYVISMKDNWRLKMFTLIFFCKYRDQLTLPDMPIISEMQDVLAGKEVKGWVPLREMQERADMYGVELR